MSKKFKLNIRPVDLFFFGQENRYRPRKENGKVKYKADYYQVSARFPQQTALLGALRYLILDIHGEIPQPSGKDWNELIGPQGFNMDNIYEKVDYGKIELLSPVYLEIDGEIYMPAPLDLYQDDEGNWHRLQAKKNPDIKTNVSEPFVEIPVYYEKVGLPEVLKKITDNASTEQCNIMEYDKDKGGVFISVEKIGINKQKSEESFYKQVFYKFPGDKDVSFTLTVDFKDDCGIKDGDTFYVPLGAEKSMFVFSFHETEDEISPQYQNNADNLPAIMLLSDAFVDNPEKAKALFSITHTKPFRFLKRKIEERDYGKFDRSQERYNLFRRGSIFYFENEDQRQKFESALNDIKRFTQIGYNKTLKIN